MLVSMSFSLVIYRGVSLEFSRRLAVIEQRIQERSGGGTINRGQLALFAEDLQLARVRMLILLGYINTAILAFSAVAGYFLAGKTLSPIEKALDDQRRFVAEAGHELKTPLASLRTGIEVALRDHNLTVPKTKKVFSESLEDISYMASLTNTLLTLARYSEYSPADLVFERFSVSDLFERVLRRFNSIAAKKSVRLLYHKQPITVVAHRDSLEKLLMILVDNAIYYNVLKGKVVITTTIHKKQLFISVKDTGIGIAKQDLPHIFDRFYRADKSRSKNISGFGLGLSIAKRIVQLHKGTIKVKSIPQKGSEFIVSLPVVV
jgi:signal transduction histidine kinase